MTQEYKRPRYYAVPPKTILEMGLSIKDARARGLFCLTYLTGARIAEAAQFRPMHVSAGRPDFYELRMVVLKKRRQRGFVNRIVPIPRGKKAKCFENEMMGEIISFVKDFPIDAFPFWVWGKPKKEYDRLLKKEVMHQRPDAMSIYLSRAIKMKTEAQVKTGNAWFDKLITKPLHPHWLRHCRAIHLIQFYGFSDSQLRQFFKWSDAPEILSAYTEVRDVSSAFE